MKKWETAFRLFCSFFKIGLFTFGGGYAMIPLIQKTVVEDKKWCTEAEALDVFAISESTPGVIAVNTATFIGCKVAGTLGALFATLGVILPSFLIATFISFFLYKYVSLEWVAYAFKGIRAGVVVLLIFSSVKLMKPCKKGWYFWIIWSLTLVVETVFGLSPILIILTAAFSGVVIQLIVTKKVASEKDAVSDGDKRGVDGDGDGND